VVSENAGRQALIDQRERERERERERDHKQKRKEALRA
jgi:hypothetical protein